MGLFENLALFLGLKKREANILIVGLDNSGKSTVINFFKAADQKLESTVPTIGFNIDKIRYGKLNITAFDMSGQSRYRSMWERYYRDCHGVVFVVDSSDIMRLEVARNELELMLKHPDMTTNKAPFLFLANKGDLPSALPLVQVRAELGLDEINDRSWRIEASVAVTGDGLANGFQWLSNEIMKNLNSKT